MTETVLETNYRRLRGIDYFLEQLETGGKVIKAIKTSTVIAKKGNPGDEVISWVEGINGEEIKERIKVVSIDPQTKEPDWVLTKVDKLGNPVIDNNGHLNQWVISDTKFRQRYEKDSNDNMLYKSKGIINEFIKVEENIYLLDKDMLIEAGGYLNTTDLENIYGISEKDFLDTYTICDAYHIKAR